MTPKWFVRHAVPTDVHAIVAIEQASAEASHWNEEIWKRVLGAGEGCEPERECFVAQNSDDVVGFVVVKIACGVAELESVAVIEPMRRQGVGRALCVAAIAWSRDASAREIALEVRASSEGAVSLYRSLGFCERGRRKGYYRDPIEDAVLMSASLRIYEKSSQGSADVPLS